jgi:hypothetical protein
MAKELNAQRYDSVTFEELFNSRLDRRRTNPIARAAARLMRIIPKLPAKSDPGNMKSLPRNTAFSVIPGSNEKMYCHARKSLTNMRDGSQIGAFLRVNMLFIPPCYLLWLRRWTVLAGFGWNPHLRIEMWAPTKEKTDPPGMTTQKATART